MMHFFEWLFHQPRALGAAFLFFVSSGMLFRQKIREKSVTFVATVALVVTSTSAFIYQATLYLAGADGISQLFESGRAEALRIAASRCGAEGVLSNVPADRDNTPHSAEMRARLGAYCAEGPEPGATLYLVRSRNRTCLYDPQADLLSSLLSVETPQPPPSPIRGLSLAGSLDPMRDSGIRIVRRQFLRFDNRNDVGFEDFALARTQTLTVGTVRARRDLCG